VDSSFRPRTPVKPSMVLLTFQLMVTTMGVAVTFCRKTPSARRPRQHVVGEREAIAGALARRIAGIVDVVHVVNVLASMSRPVVWELNTRPVEKISGAAEEAIVCDADVGAVVVVVAVFPDAKDVFPPVDVAPTRNVLSSINRPSYPVPPTGVLEAKN